MQLLLIFLFSINYFRQIEICSIYYTQHTLYTTYRVIRKNNLKWIKLRKQIEILLLIKGLPTIRLIKNNIIMYLYSKYVMKVRNIMNKKQYMFVYSDKRHINYDLILWKPSVLMPLPFLIITRSQKII